MMFPKNKRTRLKGMKKERLREEILKRDGYMCIVCGSPYYVEWHHEPCGSKRSDELEKGVTLCSTCHRVRHDCRDCTKIKTSCEEYLNNLYGG